MPNFQQFGFQKMFRPTWQSTFGPYPSFELNFLSGQGPDGFTFTRASTGTRFLPDGTLTTEAVNIPRLDIDPTTLQPRGLLLEGARTNQIRNPRGEGFTVGAIGSGGVLPTNWQQFTSGVRVVGNGTTNGIEWVDIEFSHAPGTATFIIAPEPRNQVVASSGQTWTGSWYIACVSGLSDAQALDLNLRLAGRSADGLTTFESSGTPLTSLDGTLRRFVVSHTLSNASSVRVSLNISNATASGTTRTYTLRLGYSQFEQASFASSQILPPVGAPTTATRAADSTIMTNLATLGFNPAQGTMVAEFEFDGALTANNRHIATFSDGGFNNRIRTGYKLNASTNFISDARISGSTFTSSNGTATQIGKMAVAYAENNYAFANNGSIVAWSSQPTGVPVVNRLSIGCNEPATGDFLFGWLRRLTYYPIRLPDATLQALTV